VGGTGGWTAQVEGVDRRDTREVVVSIFFVVFLGGFVHSTAHLRTDPTTHPLAGFYLLDVAALVRSSRSPGRFFGEGWLTYQIFPNIFLLG